MDSNTSLTSNEMAVYNSLSNAYNQFIKLPILFNYDQPEFATHINALKNIVLSRPAVRLLNGEDYKPQNGMQVYSVTTSGIKTPAKSTFSMLAERALDDALQNITTDDFDCDGMHLVFTHNVQKTECLFYFSPTNEMVRVKQPTWLITPDSNAVPFEEKASGYVATNDGWYMVGLKFCRNIDKNEQK